MKSSEAEYTDISGHVFKVAKWYLLSNDGEWVHVWTAITPKSVEND